MSKLDVLIVLVVAAGAGFGAGLLKKEAMLALGLAFLALEPPTAVEALRLLKDDMAKIGVVEVESVVFVVVLVRL